MPNIEKGDIEKNLILLSSYLVKKLNIMIICGKITNDVKDKLNDSVEIVLAKNG